MRWQILRMTHKLRQNDETLSNQFSPTSAVRTGDVGRSEGPGTGGEISSVVGGGMGVFESDFA